MYYIGVFKDEATLGALDPVARQSLVTEAKNELIKAKEEETRKVQEQAKRLDHITRALRIEVSFKYYHNYKNLILFYCNVYNSLLRY